jgi:hypothetical protein
MRGWEVKKYALAFHRAEESSVFFMHAVEASGERSTLFHLRHTYRQQSILRRCHLGVLFHISNIYVCIVLVDLRMIHSLKFRTFNSFCEHLMIYNVESLAVW